MEFFVPGTFLFIFFLILATMVLWIIALVDIVRSDFKTPTDKLVWVLIVLFAPFIGAILYLAVGRNNKINSN